MRTSKLLAACALGTSLIAGGAVFAPAFAQTADTTTITQVAQANQGQRNAEFRPGMRHSGDHIRMQDVDTSKWISMKDAEDKVLATEYKDIHKIKRTPYGYIVSAMNTDGARAKFAVDPINGKIEQLEYKSKRSNDRKNCK